MYNLNLTGCIIRNNDLNTIEGDNVNVTYCNIEGGCYGEGNIDIDPGFINPGYWDMNSTPDDLNDDFWVEGDYHLKSQAGRWANLDQTWIQDDVTSPCIDAGDPNSPIGFEPFPNGGVYNMGAYGRSMEASKTYFGEPVCDVILAGDINGDCVVDFDDISIVVSQWALSGGDFINCPPTVTLITPQNGDQITWPGPTTFQAEADDIDGEVISVMFRLEYKDENISQGSGFSDSNGSDGWEREYTWRDSARYGNWTAWVEATDNEGAVGISEKITITLNSP